MHPPIIFSLSRPARSLKQKCGLHQVLSLLELRSSGLFQTIVYGNIRRSESSWTILLPYMLEQSIGSTYHLCRLNAIQS
jgi:hypothetical protein